MRLFITDSTNFVTDDEADFVKFVPGWAPLRKKCVHSVLEMIVTDSTDKGLVQTNWYSGKCRDVRHRYIHKSVCVVLRKTTCVLALMKLHSRRCTSVRMHKVRPSELFWSSSVDCRFPQMHVLSLWYHERQDLRMCGVHL